MTRWISSFPLLAVAALCILPALPAARAQSPAGPSAVLPPADLPPAPPVADWPPAPPGWTDLADLALAAPVVLIGTVRRADRLGRRAAPDVPAGQVRVLVEADLSAVLKAPGLLPARAAWLWQGVAGPRNSLPFARTQPVLLFARPLAGGANPEVQAMALISPHGQQPWSAGAEAAVRAVLAENVEAGRQARMVTAVSDAARSEGTIAGRSESQFFLATDLGKPMTLVVRHTPGQPAAVLVAAGELVDHAAPIVPHTLTWRALACGMPARLPARLAADSGLAGDYALAKKVVGACDRRLAPPA